MMATTTTSQPSSPSTGVSGEAMLTFKLLLIGDSGTGKSSLLLRFIEDTFMEDDMPATIGVDFRVKHVSLQLPPAIAPVLHDHLRQNNPNYSYASASDLPSTVRVKLTIWDTAGQERFRTLTSSYYRGAQGVILTYDVTSRPSFTNLLDIWIPELDTYSPASSTSPAAVKMVIGNKLDLDETREVTSAEGLEMASNTHALFMECSAKTRVGVQQAFVELCQKILETPDLWRKRAPGSGTLNLQQQSESTDQQDGSCLC